MFNHSKMMTAMIAGAVLIGSANAAPIDWGLATDVVDTSDIVNTGTTVEAFNLGYKAGELSTVTVNGVEFASLVAPAPLTATNGGAFYGQLGGNSSGDADYDNLLNSVAYGGGGGLVNYTIGGGNLTIGSEYTVQLWYVDERTVSGYNTRVMQYGDGNGNTVDLGGTEGLLGQYVTGTFTADGTTQTITMDAQGFGNAHLTAYQIREAGAATLPGDTDGDGDIDDSDLGTSLANYTGPLDPGVGSKTAAEGDTDGDGDVDDSDLGTSLAGYTGPLSVAVPEPTSLALLGLSGLCVMRRRRA